MQESERIFIAENATLLRGSERELNRQLFTILNSIYDGLYITDGQANTILINRAYEEVSGLRREDVLGKSMQEIVATGMIDRSGSLGVLKTRKPVTLEQTFRTGKQALGLLQDTCRKTGRTVIVITHNTALTAMADRVIQVRSGQIVSNKVNEHPVPVEEIEW